LGKLVCLNLILLGQNLYEIWHSSYTEIIALENLFEAWERIYKGKRNKVDVGVFERLLEDIS